MSDSTESNAGKTPWHLWVVGVVSLLWNAGGAFDYIMTQTQNASYMSNFSQEQLDFFYGFPTWFVAVWAIGVWGAILGSILLLLRMKLAVWVFTASLAALIISMIRNFVFADGLSVMGGATDLIFTAVIFIIAVLLLWYARAMLGKGVLR